MAVVNIQENIFENDVKNVIAKEGMTVADVIKENADYLYDTIMVECYDCDTGETFYAPMDDGYGDIGVSILVGQNEVDINYIIKENDIVSVLILPKFSLGGFLKAVGVGIVMGAVAVAAVVATVVSSPAVIIGAFVGTVVIGATSILIGDKINDLEDKMKSKTSESSTEETGASSPDARDASNKNLTDNVFPFVLGEHSCAPAIVGSPYSVNHGEYGSEQTITTLYAVGYSPLLLTDFKLGDLPICKNENNVINGILNKDTGDFHEKFNRDNFNIEIIQQGNGEVDYGELYNTSVVQEEVKANMLYFPAEDVEKVPYLGVEINTDFRNNAVRFTQKYPKEIEVEVDLPKGLFMMNSVTTTSDDKSTTNQHYSKIPLNLAVQWNLYDGTDNPTGDAPGGDNWVSFDYYDNYVKKSDGSFVLEKEKPYTFTESERSRDVNAHCGSKYQNKSAINTGWIGAQVFNIEKLGATGTTSTNKKNTVSGGKDEIRVTFHADIYEYYNTLKKSGKTTKTFEEWFDCDGKNTIKAVRVRTIRISPSYIDETTSLGGSSNKTFADLTKWSYLTTKPFDPEVLRKTGEVKNKRPLSEEDMRKLCLVAVKATVTQTGEVKGRIEKLHTKAHAFQPYYENHKWFPESVIASKKYYEPTYFEDGEYKHGAEITGTEAEKKRKYEEFRLAGKDALCIKGGNNYQSQMNDIVISGGTTDKFGRTTLSDTAKKYLCNNSASAFLQAAIGPQCGIYAKGYDEFDMASIGEMFEFCKEVSDGSVYSNNLTDKYGIAHKKGDLVKIPFECNAYISKGIKLETLLSKIAITARGSYSINDSMQIATIVDKPVPYPIGMINQQNCYSSSHTMSYEQPYSGLMIKFQDENDDYDQNTLYCMFDGEDKDNPTGSIDSYSIDFVTNPIQINSLGRYMLAYKQFSKEVLSYKVGPEGYSYHIGDVLLVSDDTLSIGTDFGGRIKKIISDDKYIYGFICDELIEYTAEVDEEGLCKQGVTISQPQGAGVNRAVTLRLATPNETRKIVDHYETKVYDNGRTEEVPFYITYVMRKGMTNVILFDEKISRDGSYEEGVLRVKVFPEVDNTVAFGEIGKITGKYRIISIKPDANSNFDVTLCLYKDEFYNYGRALPVFDSNTTIRGNDDNYIDFASALSAEQRLNVIAGGPLSIDDSKFEVNTIDERGAALLSWACLDDESVSGYTIFRKTDNDDSFNEIARLYVEDIQAQPMAMAMTLSDDALPVEELPKIATYIDNDAVFGSINSYYIRAFDVRNNYGIKSDIKSTLKPIELTAKPATPAIQSAIANKDLIHIRFIDPTPANSMIQVSRYEISLKRGADADWAVVGSTKGNEFYYYYDRSGNDPYNADIASYFVRVQTIPERGTSSDYSNQWPVSVSDTYGTWQPSKPTVKGYAYKDYIDLEFGMTINNFNGIPSYIYTVKKDDSILAQGSTSSSKATVDMSDRNVFGYPEKEEFDDYIIEVTVKDIISGLTATTVAQDAISYDFYGTWIPHFSVTKNVSNRTVTLECSTNPNIQVYGNVRYAIGIQKEDGEEYFKPAVLEDPYADEENYRTYSDGQPVVTDPESIESLKQTSSVVQRVYTQTLPLNGQNSQLYKCYSFSYDSEISTPTVDDLKNEATTYMTADGVVEYIEMLKRRSEEITGTLTFVPPITEENPIPTTWSITRIGAGTINEGGTFVLQEMPQPQSTNYRYVVYAMNLDSGVIEKGSAVEVQAVANAVKDIVAGKITNNMLADDAITADKIAAGTITAKEIYAGDLAANGARFGDLRAEGFAIDEFNYWFGKQGYIDDKMINAGDFRIGSGDQYMMLKKRGNLVSLEIKVGKVDINADGLGNAGSDFTGSIAIYPEGEDEDHFHKTKRLLIDGGGIVIQTYNDDNSESPWNTNGTIRVDSNRNINISNSQIPFCSPIENSLTDTVFDFEGDLTARIQNGASGPEVVYYATEVPYYNISGMDCKIEGLDSAFNGCLKFDVGRQLVSWMYGDSVIIGDSVINLLDGSVQKISEIEGLESDIKDMLGLDDSIEFTIE